MATGETQKIIKRHKRQKKRRAKTRRKPTPWPKYHKVEKRRESDKLQKGRGGGPINTLIGDRLPETKGGHRRALQYRRSVSASAVRVGAARLFDIAAMMGSRPPFAFRKSGARQAGRNGSPAMPPVPGRPYPDARTDDGATAYRTPLREEAGRRLYPGRGRVRS